MINQFIVNGIIAGSVYTLGRRGICGDIPKVRFFHFAHGVVFNAGAYFTYFFKAWLGLPGYHCRSRRNRLIRYALDYDRSIGLSSTPA